MAFHKANSQQAEACVTHPTSSDSHLLFPSVHSHQLIRSRNIGHGLLWRLTETLHHLGKNCLHDADAATVGRELKARLS